MNIPLPTEHQIQTAIKNFLGYKGYFVIRLNSGVIKTEKGNRVHLAARGTPDLMALKSGVVLFIEVKRPGKKPTWQQEQMMQELERYGAQCIVATSIEDVEKAV